MQITLDDNNGNSAITVYKPGATIKYGSGNAQDEDPANYYHGSTIKTAPPYGKTRKINEIIQESGNSLMVVGLTLGASSELKGSVIIE